MLLLLLGRVRCGCPADGRRAAHRLPRPVDRLLVEGAWVRQRDRYWDVAPGAAHRRSSATGRLAPVPGHGGIGRGERSWEEAQLGLGLRSCCLPPGRHGHLGQDAPRHAVDRCRGLLSSPAAEQGQGSSARRGARDALAALACCLPPCRRAGRPSPGTRGEGSKSSA